MEKTTSFQVFRFIIFVFIFCFFTLFFCIENNNISSAIFLTLLCWSFYVLCVPASHGKIALNVPIQMFMGKSIRYPEVFMWFLALGLNIFTYKTNQPVYFKTFTTHLLLQILASPWPHWLIIFTSSLGTFYKFFIGIDRFKKRKIFHYFIRTLLVLLGLAVLIYFSYKEIVILINIRAKG